jgi:hypothetical protein
MTTDWSEGSASSTHNWLRGGGEMGSLIGSLPWAGTPIGAPECWSPALRMMGYGAIRARGFEMSRPPR